MGLCVSASARVVETVRVAEPSVPGAAGASAGAGASLPTVPPASILAPSLGLGASFSAPQARVHFAPPAAAETPAAVEAAPLAEPVAGRAPARKDSVPPSIQEAGRAVPTAASFQGQESAGVIAEPVAEAEPSIPVEGAAAVGRRAWDQSSEHASLDDESLVPVAAPDVAASAQGPAVAAAPGARAGRPEAVAVPAFEMETLRDAVASPAALPAALVLPRHGAPAPPPSRSRASLPLVGTPAAAPVVPAAAPSSTALNRLSLELASGLVVKVRSALGFLPASAAAPSGPPRAAPATSEAPATGVPLTSTEWLERRGLLETLSAVEFAAGGVSGAPVPAKPGRGADAAPPAPARRAPDAPARPTLPSPVFWGLAFLPAAAALLREFL